MKKNSLSDKKVKEHHLANGYVRDLISEVAKNDLSLGDVRTLVATRLGTTKATKSVLHEMIALFLVDQACDYDEESSDGLGYEYPNLSEVSEVGDIVLNDEEGNPLEGVCFVFEAVDAGSFFMAQCVVDEIGRPHFRETLPMGRVYRVYPADVDSGVECVYVKVG